MDCFIVAKVEHASLGFSCKEDRSLALVESLVNVNFFAFVRFDLSWKKIVLLKLNSSPTKSQKRPGVTSCHVTYLGCSKPCDKAEIVDTVLI